MQVRSHDGDISSPGLTGRYLQMSDAVDNISGDWDLVISPVLPEASGGGHWERQGAGREGPLA